MRKRPATNCRTCYGECDPEIHAATERVHDWLQAKILRAIQPVVTPPPKTRKVMAPIQCIGLVPKEEGQRP